MKGLIFKFLLRWAVCALGLWIAASLLGPEHLSVGSDWATVIWAGFFLALVNMLLKPVLVILSFPAIILTLGIFMLLLNGLLIMIASWLYDPLQVENFGWAIVAGIIVGLVNYLVSRILEDL